MTTPIKYTPLTDDLPLSRVLHLLVNNSEHKHKSARLIAELTGIHHKVITRLRSEPYLPSEDALRALLKYLLPQGSILAIVDQPQPTVPKWTAPANVTPIRPPPEPETEYDPSIHDYLI